MVTTARRQQRLWEFSCEEKCTCSKPQYLLNVVWNARSAIKVISIADN